ncbi:MAG TPA: CaiB/BaiF CoA-transferase family protein [Acidimicrobiales bacterium]|nr:CaiB/BaiF CoA-transferase family protein [Acidimicrobiales bacterium]
MGALEGIRVVHLMRTFPASLCTMYLADQGADVVRVEEPRYIERRIVGDGAFYTPLLQMTDRNKRSIQVDIKADGGNDVIRRLVANADVFVEGMRPGTADRLGIGYEDLRAVNDRLIYASLTGFGQDGPYSRLPGHDLNYIGIMGLLQIDAQSDRAPSVPSIPVADMAGALSLALGITTALVARASTGTGQRVDAAMSDAIAPWMIMTMAIGLAGQVSDVQEHWHDRDKSPYYNTFRCGDGRDVALGCNEPWLWANFCREIGHPELVEQQHVSGAEREAVHATVTTILAAKTSEEWIELLQRADVPITPVLSLEESYADPHIVHRDLYPQVDTPAGMLRTVGNWLKLSDKRHTIRTPAPAPGQHTDEVLRECGFDEHQVAALREQGVVA